MGEITFTGGAPYDLPLAQRAEANALGDVVQMTFFVLPPAQQESPTVPVHVRMTHKQALALAIQLKTEAMNAELAARSKG
jgi:hypothetical protein